jgi:hypothetical protein
MFNFSDKSCFTFVRVVCLRASSNALIRFTFVFVDPFVFDQTSVIPANSRIFEQSFSTFNPVPFGAGINSITHEPHLPTTLKGTVCGFPHPHCHEPHPLLILISEIFAFLYAFSLAGTVS